LFGGPALREFAIVLLFGLVLATSSSIFIAAPILLNLGEKRLRGRKVVGGVQPAVRSADRPARKSDAAPDGRAGFNQGLPAG
jgi:SecD/SecF fusion protein